MSGGTEGHDLTPLAAAWANPADPTLVAALEQLARRATRLTGASAAFVVVGAEAGERWLASAGLGQEVPAEDVLSGVGITAAVRDRGGPLLIEDADEASHLAGVPLLRDAGIRACACLPVVAPDDAIVGAFCAAHVAPRTWTDRDREALAALAHCAMLELRLQHAATELQRCRTSLQDAEAGLAETLRRVAHDQRTPLNVLSLSVQYLSRTLTSEGERGVLERMRRAIDELGAIIANARQR